MSGFIHLHNHTEYSFMDGLCLINRLIPEALKRGDSAVAITDHGVMSGVYKFNMEAENAGIKPITGIESYLRMPEPNQKKTFHITLLARNQNGYKNICQMLYHATHKWNKPVIEYGHLLKWNEDVIALSGCYKGFANCMLRDGNVTSAEQFITNMVREYGDRFYLELMRVFPSDPAVAINREQAALGEYEKKCNDWLIDYGFSKGIPLVATNDCHYITKDEVEHHAFLVKCGTKNRDFAFSTSELYYKSEAEMRTLFSDVLEAVDTTMQIADSIEPIQFSKKTKIPVAMNDWSLKDRVYKGAKERYGDTIPDERIQYELSVIKKINLEDFFMIVTDIVDTAVQNNIYISPGRGSAVGSVVCYCLGITGLDPIKYNLTFERFLIPERITMPDIDLDIDYEKREHLIGLIQDKYGQENVSRICNIITNSVKGAIKSVAKAVNIPFQNINRITRNLPEDFEISDNFVEILTREQINPLFAEKIMKYTKIIQGRPAYFSVHAGGVIITDTPVYNQLPVSEKVTHFDKNVIEELGYLKIDLLASKFATLLSKLCEEHNITPSGIDINDPRIYESMRLGRTAGITQFASYSARNLLRDFHVLNFEDVIHVNALNRPGPLSTGLVDACLKNRKEYLKKKNIYTFNYNNKYGYGSHANVKLITNPKLKDIVESTYGTIIYQEQIIAIARRYGFTLQESDVFRKAIAKKDIEMLRQFRSHFADMGDAELFDQIKQFGRYCFNRAHAAAYSYLAVLLVWFKIYHPMSFFKLAFSIFTKDSEQKIFFEEFAREGISVQPADINHAGVFPTFNGSTVYCGLSDVKNVSEVIAGQIVEEREHGIFRSLEDFEQRVREKCRSNKIRITKLQIQNLIKAGAFRNLETRSKQYVLDLKYVARTKDKKHPVTANKTAEQYYRDMPYRNNPIESQLEMLGLKIKTRK